MQIHSSQMVPYTPLKYIVHFPWYDEDLYYEDWIHGLQLSISMAVSYEFLYMRGGGRMAGNGGTYTTYFNRVIKETHVILYIGVYKGNASLIKVGKLLQVVEKDTCAMKSGRLYGAVPLITG